MRLSVIIPVYQTAKTLSRCVDSVLSQFFDDCEIILVDDGSTDDSPSLCDRFAKEHENIKVFHQEHQGLGAARNNGLCNATGDYVTFVDSDDRIASNTFAPLFTQIDTQPCDILEYPIYVHYGHPKKAHFLRFHRRTYTNMREYWLDGTGYRHAYMANKVFKRSLFDGLTFEDKPFEDVQMMIELMKKQPTIATTNNGIYFYIFNPDSITSTATGDDLRVLLNTNLEVLKQWHDASFYAYCLNIAIDVSNQTGELVDFPILPYRNTLKLRLLHLVGLKRLCRYNAIVSKLKRH